MTKDKVKYLNDVLDFVGYEGARDERNLYALSLVLNFLESRSLVKYKYFEYFIKAGCKRKETAEHFNKSLQYINEVISSYKFKLYNKQFSKFIIDGYENGETVSSISIQAVLCSIGIRVMLEGEEKVNPIDLLQLPVRTLNTLKRKGFLHVEALQEYISKNGENWHKHLYGIGDKYAKDILIALANFKESR